MTLRETPAFRDLLDVSARIGSDPLQVQGPGGNTSLKSADRMIIKASGTWLSDAGARNIFVGVDLARLRGAVEDGSDAARRQADFVTDDPANDGLRPSIETTVHAVMPHAVVLHTHCVWTIATAVRQDAARIVADRLGDLGAVHVPYVMPGVDLAQAIRGALRPDSRIVVLGNHGLVVGADTARDAEALLTEVARRLSGPVQGGADAAPALAQAAAAQGWMPVPHALTQAIAFDPGRLDAVRGSTLYPDHLIFLGPGVTVGEPGAEAGAVIARAAEATPFSRLAVVPGQGVAIPADASASVLALARALGDVLARLPGGAPLVRLSRSDEAALLDWDDEKYRQALDAKRRGA